MFKYLYLLLALGVFSLIGWIFFIPVDEADALLKEGAFIETASAVLWLVAAVVLLTCSTLLKWRKGWAGSVILVAFALRELDFQKRFTTMSVSKIKFFLSGEVPVLEKIIAGCILFFLLWAFYMFIRGEFSPYLERLRRLDGPAVALASFFLLLPISKILDRFPNALKESGIFIGKVVGEKISIFEETIEFGLPILATLVILHFFTEKRKELAR